MKFCPDCGAGIEIRVPAADNRPRHVCTRCEAIHYQNPRIVAGCLPCIDGRILLCRRAIEPRSGYWTLPAGYMELGETSTEAALRETMEEANARVEIEQLYTILNLPHVNQVYMMFRARLLDLDFSPGEESLEAELFSKDAIPWEELAFPTVDQTLRFMLEDEAEGEFRMRIGDIVRREGGYDFVPGPGRARA